MFRLLQQKDEVIYDEEPLTIVRERSEGQISQSNHSEKWTRYFEKRLEMTQWLATHKPEFYQKEKPFFEDNLFGILKIIANEDFKTSRKLYKNHLKGLYRPSPTQDHSTRPYLVLYKVLGFRGAEIFRKLLGKG